MASLETQFDKYVRKFIHHLWDPKPRIYFYVSSTYTCVAFYYLWCVSDDVKAGYMTKRSSIRKLSQEVLVSDADGLNVALSPATSVTDVSVSVETWNYELNAVKTKLEETQEKNRNLDKEKARQEETLKTLLARRKELEALVAGQTKELKKHGV
eukprot:PhF_6_TR19459/c0_g1_i1/m.28446